MRNFDWNKFINGKLIVHCDTYGKAKSFLKECDERGIVWTTGTSTLNFTAWELYKENTCYGFSFGSLGYDHINYFERLEEFEIVKWEVK